jgi:hypothetical protein
VGAKSGLIRLEPDQHRRADSRHHCFAGELWKS